jgi:hypothetical protein
MMRPVVFGVLLIVGVAGCGGEQRVVAARETAYSSLERADEAFRAKKYADAIPGYNSAITGAGLQADVLAEAYLKRAVCKTETGDVAGAAADLEKAEQGGAVGDDYQAARKRLDAKRSGS